MAEKLNGRAGIEVARLWLVLRALVGSAELVASRVVQTTLSSLPRPRCCLTLWGRSLLAYPLQNTLILVGMPDANDSDYLRPARDRHRGLQEVLSAAICSKPME